MTMVSARDPFAELKESQKKAWSTFAPTELLTCMPAARLAAFARPAAGQSVLDVGCGTGVVAIAAARSGAKLTGIDLTPELIERAQQNSAITGADIEWHVGDAEAMPFENGQFDMVLSQFGHMFTPRPDVVTQEMLRVLKPGGTIAFATWPPELFSGRMFALVGKYLPPPAGAAPPPQWGRIDTVLERLGSAVNDIAFDRGVMRSPALSPQHMRTFFETSVGPVMKIVQTLASEPERLAAFRTEFDALIAEYFEPTENVLRQDYLLTRGRKA